MPHTAFHQIDDEDRRLLAIIYEMILDRGPSDRIARERYADELALITRLRDQSGVDV